MRVDFKVGNIVDEPTEGLVCTGNVQLNMSGGVNGELLVRGGASMQRQLHDWLKRRGIRVAEPGFVMRIGPEPFPFKTIVYAVGVDIWYDSSVELVARTLSDALRFIEEDGCRTVAVPALATGYGHLSKEEFGVALRQVLEKRSWPFEEVHVVTTSPESLDQIRRGYQTADT